jgi:phosphatidylglycerophosphatase C
MNLALFDFDGTITTGDMFSPFLKYAIPSHRQVLGGFVLAPILAAYRLGLITAPVARPLVCRVGFQSVSASALRARGATYASEVLPTTERREAMDRIAWHKAQGDTLVVVSAGLDVYLRPWCDAQGVALICTELEERDGRLTGRYRQGDCSGQTKVDLVRAALDLERFDIVYAYGDSVEDREMLSLADRRYYRWRELADGEEIG